MFRRNLPSTTEFTGEYVTVQLLDSHLPDNETAERNYGRAGKFFARNRARVVCVGLFLAITGAILFGGLFMYLVVQSLRVRASGLDVALIDAAENKTIHMSDGQAVTGVVEPVAQMVDTQHARLLLEDPLFQSPRPLTVDDLRAGHLEWTAAEDRPRVKFTLDYMERLVRRHANESESTCVCYAAYGLPHNIVYLSGDDTVAYEPRVVQEFQDRVVRIRSECSLHSLLEETRRRMQDDTEPRGLETGKEHFMTTNSSGIVEYMRRSGKRVRQRMDLPLFPCVKHCVRFFVQ